MKPTAFLISLIICLKSFGQPEFSKAYPDTLNKKKLITTLSVGAGTYISGISFLSFVWYKDKERVTFHYYNDSQGYLQMDKAGHAFGAYRESFAAYYALRWAGMDKKRALMFGGPIGLIFQTPIEIFDGLYEGWGFSWPDMIANTFGSALFTTQEALFNEQVVLMKFSYSPSIYPNYHTHLGETPLESFFLDYNGHTYWLSGNLNKITGVKTIPSFLNLAIGYSANGMIYEFENPKFYQGKPFPNIERYREFLLSLDLDLSRIKTQKPWLKKLLRAMNILKVPFPAIEFNSLGSVKFKPFYF